MTLSATLLTPYRDGPVKPVGVSVVPAFTEHPTRPTLFSRDRWDVFVDGEWFDRFRRKRDAEQHAKALRASGP